MTPAVAVILPCRGRFDQTIAVGDGLRARAGAVDAEWWAVGGHEDDDTIQSLSAHGWRDQGSTAPSLTYWQALDAATRSSTALILACVANDLAPAARWLELGLAAYRARFPDGEGLLGFSGDGHPVGHSCHFLIGRGLLADLGGWPIHYRHNFGDAELCLRAQEIGRYGKATRAVLEHRHPMLSFDRTIPDDAVYAAGRATWAQDQRLFEARKARNWT